MTRASALAVTAFLMCASGFAQSSGVKPTPNASPEFSPSLAHDTHEGMTILADSYDEPARAKEKFGKADPIQVGILPVEVFLRNESDHPIRIDLNTIPVSYTHLLILRDKLSRFLCPRLKDVDFDAMGSFG